MVAFGAGFHGGTLYDVTPLKKLCLKVDEYQKKSLSKNEWVFRPKVQTKNKRSSMEIECIFGPNK